MRLTLTPLLAMACVLLFAAGAFAQQSGSSGISVSTAAGIAPPHSAPIAPSPAPFDGESLFLDTTDGHRIAAWYWAPLQSGAPWVILVHMRGGHKGTWGDMPRKLVDEGFAVAAIDLRGHGESLAASGRPLNFEGLTENDYQAMLGDIAAAHVLFETRSAVDADRVAVIGASIGANLAIMYAAGDERVRTAVALSPGLNFMGLQPLSYLPGYDRRALYLVVASGDEYSYKSCHEIEAQALADPASIRSFDGTEHGTDLLEAHRGLDATIVSGWLLNHLPPRGSNIT